MSTAEAFPSPAALPRSVWSYVLFTGIIFGLGGLVSKGLIDDGVDPFVMTWVPFLSGGVLATLAGWRRHELRVAALGPAALLGVSASAIPALLFNTGFEKLPAGIVTLLISLGPVFTAIVAHFVFSDERFNATKASGLALAISGVGVLAAGSIEGDGSAGAMVAVLVGAMIAGAAGVLARRVVLDHGAAAVVAPQLVIGGLAAMTLSFALGHADAPVGGYAVWHIPLMLGFGALTHVGFLSMLRANEDGTTGQVSVIGYFVPLFGVVGGIVVFGDTITGPLVIGGSLIIVAMTAIARGSSARPAAHPETEPPQPLAAPA